MNLQPKHLLILGGSLFCLGCIWWLAQVFGWNGKLGKLPGDFHFKGHRFHVSIPLMTCLILSLLLTLVAHFFNNR